MNIVEAYIKFKGQLIIFVSGICVDQFCLRLFHSNLRYMLFLSAYPQSTNLTKFKFQNLI